MNIESILLECEGQNYRVPPMKELIELTDALWEEHPEYKHVNRLIEEKDPRLKALWKKWGAALYGLESFGRPLFQMGFPVSDRVMQGINRLSTTEVFDIIDSRITPEVIEQALQGKLPGRSARSILLHGTDWIPIRQDAPGETDEEGERAYNAQKSRRRNDFDKIRLENYLDRKYADLADEYGISPSEVLVEGKLPPAGIARAKSKLEEAFFAGLDVSTKLSSHDDVRDAIEIARRFKENGSLADRVASMLPDGITADYIANDVTAPDQEGNAQGGSLIGNIGESIVLWTLASYKRFGVETTDMQPGMARLLRSPIKSLLTQIERNGVRIRDESIGDAEQAGRRYADARIRLNNLHALVEIKTYPNQDSAPERVEEIIEKYRGASAWHDGKPINRKLAVLHTPNGSGEHAANLLEHAGWSVLSADDSLDSFRHAIKLVYEHPKTHRFFSLAPFPVRDEQSLYRLAEMVIKRPFVLRTKSMRIYRQWANELLREKLTAFIQGTPGFEFESLDYNPGIDWTHVTEEYPADMRVTQPVEGTVFYDMESTGFGPGQISTVHALVYQHEDQMRADAYFVSDPTQEEEVLKQVRSKLERADRVVTFNGNGFDVRMLNGRLLAHRQRPAELNHLDLQTSWPNNLRSYELAAGFNRGEDVSGSSAPRLYSQFLKGSGSVADIDALIRHCVLDAVSLVSMYHHHESGRLDQLEPVAVQPDESDMAYVSDGAVVPF